MKILKSAKQKNVGLDTEFYTEYEIAKLLQDKIIWYFDDEYKVSYNTCDNIVKPKGEYRIFTELIARLEVEYSKEWEFYVTVAILHDGTKLYVVI